MQRIVVNAKPGGFALSREAASALGLEMDDEPSFMKPIGSSGKTRLPEMMPALSTWSSASAGMRVARTPNSS